MAKNLTFISVEHFLWFGYLRIDNSLGTPLPFGNLPPLDLGPSPQNFQGPPWGGYGYFLEPHISNLK